MRILLVLPVVAACGGGDPTHWKDQPTETVTSTFKGHGYTIDLPKGMKKSEHTDWEDEYQYHQEVHGEGYTFSPSIGVSWSDKKSTLDDGMKREKTAPIDKQQAADGWIFSVENDSQKGKDDFLIRAEKWVGEGALTCSARVYPMKKGEDAKPLIPLVEKMCLSIKAK